MPAANPNILTIEVKFDGATKVSGPGGDVETREGSAIQRIQVDQRLDAPDYFSITLQSDVRSDKEEEFPLVENLKPGMEVEIYIGVDPEMTLFKGEISYIEPSFSPEEHLITVSGYDKIHRMTRGTSSRTWGDGHEINVEYGSVANDVISQSKARKGETSDSLSGSTESGDAKRPYLAQFEMNDYQFMQSLGRSAAIAVASQSADDAAKVEFKKTDTTASPVITICREKPDPADSKMALRADFALSTVEQAAMVEVRGWDVKKKTALLGKADGVSSAFDGTTGPATAGTAHYGSGSTGRTVTIVDVPIGSQDEADEIAAAVFDDLAMEFVTADVEFQGDPTVKPGDIVEIKQYGTRYSGKYMVDGATHLAVAGARDPYVTRLHLVRNAAPEP